MIAIKRLNNCFLCELNFDDEVCECFGFQWSCVCVHILYIYIILYIYVSSPENHLLKRQAFAERSLQEASFLLRNVTSKNQPRCGFYPRKHEIWHEFDPFKNVI
jgi:hypothetical protein